MVSCLLVGRQEARTRLTEVALAGILGATAEPKWTEGAIWPGISHRQPEPLSETAPRKAMFKGPQRFAPDRPDRQATAVAPIQWRLSRKAKITNVEAQPGRHREAEGLEQEVAGGIVQEEVRVHRVQAAKCTAFLASDGRAYRARWRR